MLKINQMHPCRKLARNRCTQGEKRELNNI
jgi:hypothetical protein